MHIPLIISIVQITAGSAIMLLCISISLKIRRYVSGDLSSKWLLTISLMVFFFLGYIVSLSILIFKVRLPFELVTGSIFLGGACFVYVVVKLTEISVHRLKKQVDDYSKLGEKLRTLSLSDELTGLYNRRGFLTLAEQQLKIAHREKRGVSLMYADLDDLKAINDGFGHKAGDMMLIKTAELLRQVFRTSDIIARIGGDEFVVFSIESTDTMVESVRKRFEQHLREYNEKRDFVFRLMVSIGVVFYEYKCPFTVEELLSEADRMMYKQKRSKGGP